MKKLLGGAVLATLVVLGLGGVAGASAPATPLHLSGTPAVTRQSSNSTINIPIPGVGTVTLQSESPGVFICVGVELTSDPSGDVSACYINGQNVLGENVDVLLIHIGQNSEPIEISFNPLAVCLSSGCTGLGSLHL
jgi:hypothetical protein